MKGSNSRIISSDTSIIPESRKTNIAIEDTVGDNGYSHPDCVRGQAESIIRKSVYPNAIFKLNPDNHSGIETVDLNNGDRLIIRNHGCEYFILTFRFETSRYQADTTDTNYWLGTAVTLLKEIEAGVSSPLNLGAGIETILIRLASTDGGLYDPGEEIVVSDGGMRDFLTLDRIERVGDSRFALEISYVRGPL